MSRMRKLLALVVCVGASIVPAQGFACAICTAARDDTTEQAFRMTTLFLSALPPLMLGSLVLWLWLRSRSRARALAAATAVAAAAPVAIHPSEPRRS